MLLVAYVVWVAAVPLGDPLPEWTLQHADSYDWLTNALRYTGVPVNSSWRSMILPFVYAVFLQLSLDDLIPWLGPLYLLVTVGMLLTLGVRAAGWAAIAAATLTATNHLILGFGLTIGSDVAASVLGLTGLLALYVAIQEESPAHLYLAVVTLVVGTLVQPTIPFQLPGLACVLLYDPRSRFGVGLGPLRWLWASRHGVGAAAAGVALIAAAYGMRGWLAGEMWPVVTVQHVSLIDPSLRHWWFYVLCSIGAWGIPATVLLAVGVWAGLRDPARRRLTLGLVGMLVGAAAFFAFAYGWRGNRFVVYWTLPGLVLAGLGVEALGRLRWPVLLIAAVYGNLVVRATLEPPGHEAVLVRWPAKALVLRYGSIPPYGLWVAGTDSRGVGYRRALKRWVKERRRQYARPRADPPQFGRARQLIGQLAGLQTRPAATVYLRPDDDTSPTVVYMWMNQLALAARRRVIVLRGAPGAPIAPPGSVVALHTSELARLRAAGQGEDRVTELQRVEPWALVRTARAP